MLILMTCMNCNKDIPAGLDICAECWEKQKNSAFCVVCGSLVSAGACLNHECVRNDYELRGEPGIPKPSEASAA